jgi:6-pyruvoyltetrahydropterin/6-carboxytetrahydropterin synthase
MPRATGEDSGRAGPPIATLTRRVSFAAAHRYRRPEWDDARNAEVFGLCARPHYHGHTYLCDVSVSGPIDPVTGMVIDLAILDRTLGEEIGERFDHRNLNLDIPEFADGAQIPTTENLAHLIFDRVQSALEGRVRVTCVRVAEDDRLWAEIRVPG